MTAKPCRLRLSRRAGFRLPPSAVVVARPSRWGNPFRFRRAPEGGWIAGDDTIAVVCPTKEEARAATVRLYAERIAPKLTAAELAPLRGRDLACWCPLEAPCHADILLKLANRDPG